MTYSNSFDAKIQCEEFNEVSPEEYAEQEKFDLESEWRNLYGIPVEWVSREQRSALFSQVLEYRARRLKASGFHHHRGGARRRSFRMHRQGLHQDRD